MQFHVEDSNNDITTVRWFLAWLVRKSFFNLGPIGVARHGGKFVGRPVCTTYSHAVMEVLIHIPFTPNMAGGQDHLHDEAPLPTASKIP
jgi:hypothetical protein